MRGNEHASKNANLVAVGNWAEYTHTHWQLHIGSQRKMGARIAAYNIAYARWHCECCAAIGEVGAKWALAHSESRRTFIATYKTLFCMASKRNRHIKKECTHTNTHTQ